MSIFLNLKHMEKIMPHSYLFVCDRPLQILNSVNFILGNNLNENDNCDICIYGEFNNAKSLYESLKKTNIFRDVIFIRQLPVYSGIINKVFIASCILFPRQTLTRYSSSEIKIKNSYDFICYTFPSIIAICLKRVYKYSKTIGLEDGSANYIGDVLSDFSSKTFDAFNKILFHGKLTGKYDVLYLNNPKMACDHNCLVKRLPPLNDRETFSKLSEIFHYEKNEIYLNNKIVYLTQPLNELKGFKEDNEIDLLKKIKDIAGERWVVRVHPKQKIEGYSEYNLDSYNNMWELECINQIRDDNVLVGTFSTAQFYPKILVDKEPCLIFTYKLLIHDSEKDEYWLRASQMIEKLKRAYRDPDKVFVPGTVDEFRSLLNMLSFKSFH